MNKITELFPDWNMMAPGNWSKHGIIIPCKDKDRKVEIGLYREHEGEYAGTYTLQIFSGDDVVVCETVDPTTPDPATLTIDDRNYHKSITKVRVYNNNDTYKDYTNFENIPVFSEQKIELFHDKKKEWHCYENLGIGESCYFYVPRGASGNGKLVIDGNKTCDLFLDHCFSHWAQGVIVSCSG